MAIEPLTIKAQTVMQKLTEEKAEERGGVPPSMVCFLNFDPDENEGEGTSYYDKMLFMSEQHWRDMASPETITVSIVPGDQLNNENEQGLTPAEVQAANTNAVVYGTEESSNG